jgi:hypothetical protein
MILCAARRSSGRHISVPFEEGRRWQAAPQGGDPVGVFEEDIGSETPIVGMQCGVDGNAANDDGPKRHEFDNMIEHPQFLLLSRRAWDCAGHHLAPLQHQRWAHHNRDRMPAFGKTVIDFAFPKESKARPHQGQQFQGSGPPLAGWVR